MSRSFAQTIPNTPTVAPDLLSKAIVEAMPRLDQVERRLAVAIYRALAQGAPVRLADAAADAAVDRRLAADLVDGWNGVYRDEIGEVIGFWGLALEGMPHRIEIEGNELTAWCAWDPLFIVPLLGTTATVRSLDPVSGEEVSLVVSPDGVGGVTPAEAHVSFRVPDEPWDESVVQSFCHFVLYFASLETGSRWVASHPGTVLVSVEDAFEVGRRVDREVFGLEL